MTAIDKFTGEAGTGRELALALAGRFPREDWIAELARRSGSSRDAVEWHLQEDMKPPAEIHAAAREMLADGDRSDRNRGGGQPRDGAAEPGLTSPDDLPVAGLPGNLGKLRKD